MQKNVRSSITNETIDPAYTGPVGLVIDGRILHLDAANAKTATHGKIANSAALRDTEGIRSGCARSRARRTRLRCNVHCWRRKESQL